MFAYRSVFNTKYNRAWEIEYPDGTRDWHFQYGWNGMTFRVSGLFAILYFIRMEYIFAEATCSFYEINLLY